MRQNDQNTLVTGRQLIVVAGLFAAAAMALWFQGRVWWCQAGDYWPWAWNIWTEHNSQHVVDPYSFTHILHGILEFWLIGLLFGGIPLRWLLVIALAIEATWEVVENSPRVIEHYRTETISLNYFGDSIINSLSDTACCALGFWLGYRLRFWRSALLFVATELILLATIRDSLVLNIIMLLYRVDAVKQWQMGT